MVYLIHQALVEHAHTLANGLMDAPQDSLAM
jgi:hypothetical protein